MIICECGKLVKGNTFKEYIRTSANPSTATTGHTMCGLIFNFIDDKQTMKYSSRKELKSIAVRFSQKNNLHDDSYERFMIEVDRLKSQGKLSDYDILLRAFQVIKK